MTTASAIGRKRRLTGLGLAAALLAAGCRGEGALTPGAGSGPRAPAARPLLARSPLNGRCRPFGSDLDELAACERANGTLRTFGDPAVEWRVRFYVRYSEMPCREMPTVAEAYVFRMVTGDLDADADLGAAQRVRIRDAMFSGLPHCR